MTPNTSMTLPAARAITLIRSAPRCDPLVDAAAAVLRLVSDIAMGKTTFPRDPLFVMVAFDVMVPRHRGV